MRKTCALGILLALCVLPWPSTAQGGTLINGSFEAGWHEQGSGELVIPDGWTLEYRDGDHPWCRPPCHRPEVKPNQEFVVHGAYSARSFTTFSRGLYGLYQEVTVEPGTWWTFTCDARLESRPEGELAAFAGIQPWGGGLFERQMIWGPEVHAGPEGDWTQVSVTAQAYGGRIRVAIGANNKWPTKDNTVWWDNCRLQPADVGDCPECPDECPECPGAFDWVKFVTLLRAVVNDELANREPVRWP